jgi:mRNA interferase RelE/StbE
MYKLKFLDKALVDLKKIDRAHQRIIIEKLLILAKNPSVLKDNIKRIGGTKDKLYRLRVGSYRILFKKERERLIIIVVRIGHRKVIYISLQHK